MTVGTIIKQSPAFLSLQTVRFGSLLNFDQRRRTTSFCPHRQQISPAPGSVPLRVEMVFATSSTEHPMSPPVLLESDTFVLARGRD